MNKFLIVLMAVCLVSVHAFVKRDAPAAPADKEPKDYIQQFTDQLKTFGNDINEKIKGAINLDDIKKSLDSTFDKISEAVNKVKDENTPKQ